jgi:putative hydrolase of the HAD superfamily
MTIEAVIFDLDNTLVNRKNAFKKYSEQFIDQFVQAKNLSNKDEIIEYMIVADRDGYRKKREFYEELLMNFKMKNGITVDDLLDFWFSEFFKCTVLMDGAIEILVELKSRKIKLGLITNGSVHSQNSKIDQVGIRDYFDDIIVSDEVEVKKPDKRIFDLALKRLNVEPQFSLYIGDHPINDVKGAMDAGINAVWFKGFKEWGDTIGDPQYTIDRLNELKMILEDFSKKPRSFW